MEFKYNTNAVSEDVFNEHLRLYHNYVEKYNEVCSELDEYMGCKLANKNYSRYRGIKKGETFNLNAILLHELYFKNMTNKENEPQDNFKNLISRPFGNFRNWCDDFIACAKASRGWVVTCFEQKSGKVKNILIDSHDIGIVMFSYPILVLDMWEHSHPNDLTQPEKYIDRFIQSIDWNVVEERVKSLGVQ